MILAPLIKEQKGEHLHVFDDLKIQGYVRMRVNGITVDVDDIPKLNYLTVLDYIILTSYFFAFLSTIVTLILSFRFNKQGEANGEYHKWDKPFGIFLPIAYTVIMIGWLFPVYFIN